jgi:hypothetical protein
MFRMTVTSSDGKKCGVRIRVSENRVRPNTRKQIANCLRVELDQVDDVLENWTPEQLRAHLEKFPAEVLDSPPDERKFTHVS